MWNRAAPGAQCLCKLGLLSLFFCGQNLAKAYMVWELLSRLQVWWRTQRRLKWTRLKILSLLLGKTDVLIVFTRRLASQLSRVRSSIVSSQTVTSSGSRSCYYLVLQTKGLLSGKNSLSEDGNHEEERLSWPGQLFWKLQPWRALRTGSVVIWTLKSHFVGVQSLRPVTPRPHGLQHNRLLFHWLLKFVQTRVHWIGDALQSSHFPSSSCTQSFPASEFFPVSQLFTSVSQVLELQLQHQSFQWIFRVGFL